MAVLARLGRGNNCCLVPMLTINEIFHSIQGESTHTGRPCVFVRLTACDLRCSWCDTPYAFHEGRKMSIDQVVADVTAFECPVVEITGGEPLLQPDVYPLMSELLQRGHTVLLETGGHRSVAQVPAGVIRIIDVKCPASGESAKNDWSNLDLLSPTDEVKFVVQDRQDYEFAKDVIRRHALEEGAPRFCCRPCTVCFPATSLRRGSSPTVSQCGCSCRRIRYIWSADARGV